MLFTPTVRVKGLIKCIYKYFKGKGQYLLIHFLPLSHVQFSFSLKRSGSHKQRLCIQPTVMDKIEKFDELINFKKLLPISAL